MRSIVASDLDGTLLNADHLLSPFSKQVLRQLTDQGIHFIFATGRHYVDVLQRKEEMGINAYMVTSNGATIHDVNGDLILERTLPESIVYDLTHIALDDPFIYTHVYQGETWLTNREDHTAAVYWKEIDFKYQLSDLKQFATDKIYKVFFTSLDGRSHLERVKALVEARFGDQVDATFSSAQCLDVMVKGVSKGAAIRHIVNRLNYSMHDVIAFGDSMNDYEMLSWVGQGYLMENANEDLKQALPNHPRIGRNSEEAVPHFLRALYL